MVTEDTKTVMFAHSKAKVELYCKYLEKYLSILCNNKYITNISIFDLFCGEGIFQDGEKGSPIAAIEIANKILSMSPNFPSQITFTFNDNGQSGIELGVLKVDRVKKVCDSITCHPNISYYCSCDDFHKALNNAIYSSQRKHNKSLFFIDPYGYKLTTPDIIKQILANKDNELLLFLPASHMYRFCAKATNNRAPGHEPLYQFLKALFKKNIPKFENIHDFINQLKNAFSSLSIDDLYVDTFKIARDVRNTYCLFFFTKHALGFEKMLQTKWEMDDTAGLGFSIKNTQPSLFTGITIRNYPQLLKNHLLDKISTTNKELYYWGLKEGFLPTHTVKCLNYLKTQGFPLEISSLDSLPAKGYYITYKNASSNPDRLISIGITNGKNKDRMD